MLREATVRALYTPVTDMRVPAGMTNEYRPGERPEVAIGKPTYKPLEREVAAVED
jgi:hypothetical protein